MIQSSKIRTKIVQAERNTKFNKRKQRNTCIFFVERGKNSTKLKLFGYLPFPYGRRPLVLRRSLSSTCVSKLKLVQTERKCNSTNLYPENRTCDFQKWQVRFSRHILRFLSACCIFMWLCQEDTLRSLQKISKRASYFSLAFRIFVTQNIKR